MNVLQQFKQIRLFVFDVDGVLTDGKLLLLDDGQMARTMNIRDGYALQLAIKKGYEVLVISGGTSEGSVQNRLNKLGIQQIYMGIKDKVKVLQDFMHSQQFNAAQILYMGDDLPDLEAMKLASLPTCPADAAPEIKSVSHYISPFKGGEGCVRDVIEKVLKLNDHWNELQTVASS
jgi:3-deoxy-D-manno-octulosonate 8-phosphate phosphatase (KDO 8-P phosphatase)